MKPALIVAVLTLVWFSGWISGRWFQTRAQVAETQTAREIAAICEEALSKEARGLAQAEHIARAWRETASWYQQAYVENLNKETRK